MIDLYTSSTTAKQVAEKFGVSEAALNDYCASPAYAGEKKSLIKFPGSRCRTPTAGSVLARRFIGGGVL